MPKNLWPTFDVANRKSVKSILVEYGSGIAERTEDRIRFQVETSPDDDRQSKYHCSLVVPAISYYLPFMTVSSRSDRMFPASIHTDVVPAALTPRTEAEFVDALERVFTAPATVAMVHQLLDAAG